MKKEDKKLQKAEAKAEKKLKKMNKKNKPEKQGFFTSLKSEMKKVKWPSFKEIVKYTIATIILIIIIALLFEVLNIIISLVKGLFN